MGAIPLMPPVATSYHEAKRPVGLINKGLYGVEQLTERKMPETEKQAERAVRPLWREPLPSEMREED